MIIVKMSCYRGVASGISVRQRTRILTWDRTPQWPVGVGVSVTRAPDEQESASAAPPAAPAAEPEPEPAAPVPEPEPEPTPESEPEPEAPADPEPDADSGKRWKRIECGIRVQKFAQLNLRLLRNIIRSQLRGVVMVVLIFNLMARDNLSEATPITDRPFISPNNPLPQPEPEQPEASAAAAEPEPASESQTQPEASEPEPEPETDSGSSD
ncbi:hypothetical protein B0H13DRAFT_1887996 [Mycena leptocephala]|nr:hypothetical protein B0H13DRAFT_1887996 [Mycena leptocephala]